MVDVAGGQIQARSRESQLGDQKSGRGNLVVFIEVDSTRGVHEMVVHADQAGHHAATGKVDHACTLGNWRGPIRHQGNFSLAQNDRTIGQGRGARSIDDAHVSQRDDGVVIRHEFAYFGR